ncbi:DNA polymerase III subunit gamma/tau [Halocynthiibacter namhaensis]|uniref:DNA polymerase III subunit gamma/tau n=1 Tax=Halocynthiibacter namhaensis TaxID=1290553 RepID=UPI00057934FA|nr:DNA polymerase III subunit gamma/tau [Halocynthiibacter namhaensis]
MSETTDTGYQVLARKYRPASFADLKGQDAMVRTLKNAFEADRIAQAFMMTGIRGTGKTTTARIIAKGMNCIGLDGNSGPTTEPCGQCEHCVSIMEGRHVDVIEMDGASQTKIDDIRSNVLDTVHYAPASARYKIYIIDEVHMLSNSAFNALLKTLEEPPAHVKFIFATTEIRKVPVTVLSRCQRFDLRRIEPEVMIAHLQDIAAKEDGKISDDALALITRAAEGSARDAMSLLDQALSHGAGETTAEQVRAMLGLADRGRVLDLFDLIMKGDAAGALTELSSQYADGADPMAVLRDLAEITHWVSVIKITPEAAEDPTVGPDERMRGQTMAEALPMRVMTRMWQMLLKSLEEVAAAPNAMMAAEMAVIRMTHVADLPTPDDLVRKLQNTPAPSGPPPTGGGSASTAGNTAHTTSAHSTSTQVMTSSGGGGSVTALAPQTESPLARYPEFSHVVELIRSHRDAVLQMNVERFVRLVSYSPGRIEFQPTDDAPNDLAQVLGQKLQQFTGARWAVSIVSDGGGKTIDEVKNAASNALKAEAEAHPLYQAVIATFPGAKIAKIRTVKELAQSVAAEALPEVEDEWDPFEDE